MRKAAPAQRICNEKRKKTVIIKRGIPPIAFFVRFLILERVSNT
jgi:hypothetical protein